MELPVHIGRYRVTGLLGKGAMGVVYRGHDDSLDREVAIKVMAPGPDADEESRKRFQREARAAARLQHPNIVTVYELGEHERAPFMVLELLEGLDLQRAIEGGLRPDFRVNAPIVLQVLAGLGHAHEHGIVHRDVKPSNVFLPRGRPAKIMDFGVARLAGGTTRTGAMVGTPNYMSPEQVRGGPLDGRSDLFSVGLILYELVTGEKAYRSGSVVSLLFKIAHEPPDLSLLPRGAQWEGLRRVVVRGLVRDPGERYADAQEMSGDLERVLLEMGGSPDWATASPAALVLRGGRGSTMADPTRPRSATAPAPMVGMPVPGRPFGATPTPPSSTSVLEIDTRRAGPSAPRPAQVAAAAGASRAGFRSRPAVLAASLVGLLGLAGGAAVLIRLGERTPSPPKPSAPIREGTPTSLATEMPAPPSAPAPRSQAATVPPRSPIPAPAAAATPATLRPTPTPRPERTDESAEEPDRSPPVAPDEARLERANDLFEKGRFAAALAEAKGVLGRDPTNAAARALAEDAEAAIVVEVRLRNARAALKRDDRETALAEVKAGLAVSPGDGRLLALFRELTQ